MKKYIYLLSLSLFIGVKAQIQNLSNLSTGQIEYNIPILDNNKNLSGYALYFNKGLNSEESMIKYEYILLDKSLNKLANSDFELPFNKKLDYRLSDSHFSDGKLYTNYRVYHLGKKDYLGYVHVALNVKDKNIIDTKFIRDFEVADLPSGKDLGKQKDVFSYNTFDKLVTKGEGKNIFNVYSHNTTTVTFENKIKEIGVLNQNHEEVYKYKAPKEGIFNIKDSYLLDVKEGKLLTSNYVLKMSGLKAITEVDSLYVRDLNTKKTLLKINHLSKVQDKSMPQKYWGQLVDDKILVTNSLVDVSLNMRGIRKTIYDNKGTRLIDETIFFKDIFSVIGFGTKKFDDGFKLAVVEIFNFNDLSTMILLEKKKIRMDKYGNDKSKTDDYILLYLNENAEVVSHYVLEKNKIGDGYDSFLFAQTDIDNNELYIYYEDLDIGLLKVKSRDLVVTKFSEGKFTQEKIPYKTDQNYLRFNNAKFGHILISEFNEKEEPVSIRLERVNL